MVETVKNEIEIDAIAAGYTKAAESRIAESKKEVLSNALIVKIETIKVTSQESLKDALELLAALKLYYKEKEDRRKAIVDPINKSVKLINEDYHKITDKINEAIATVTAQILKYRTAEAKRIEEANKREADRVAKELADIQAKAAKELKGTRGEERQDLLFKTQEKMNDVVDNTKVRAQVKTIEGTGISFRKIWTYDEIDINKVPRQFLELNRSAVSKAISEGVRDIPGIKIYQKETPSLK